MQIDKISIYGAIEPKCSWPSNAQLLRREDLFQSLKIACEMSFTIKNDNHSDLVLSYENNMFQTHVEYRIIQILPLLVEIRVKVRNQQGIYLTGTVRDNIFYADVIANRGGLTSHHIEYILYLLAFMPKPYRIEKIAQSTRQRTISYGKPVDIQDIDLRF